MYEHDYYRFSRKGMLPVRWMAPESLADGLFTPMSDIWSFGVLLYEMITFGSFPFQGLSNNQVLEHVKSGNTLAIPSGIKPQLETLLRSCWSITPTKRPTAAEIAELLANNPRLISPCIDVPLASVQIERTDSLELIPSMRKPSGSISQTNRPTNSRKRHRENSKEQKEAVADPPANNAYSPMNGQLVSPTHTRIRGDTNNTSSSGYSSAREPLLYQTRLTIDCDGVSNDSTATPSSYVPPGYIVLDHRGNNAPEFTDYVPSSVASV
jgi:serine/threonine protein kinase